MTTPRPGLPEFWVTGLAKLLVGENPCHFEAWIKGHFRIDKLPRDESKITEWKMAHTEQLSAAIQRCKDDGWKCQVERYFRVQGETGIMAGKADLVTQRADAHPIVRDIKSGKPRDSDAAQVMIYIVALPIAWSVPTMRFEGEVIYPTHTLPVRYEDAQALKPRLFSLLRLLGSKERTDASPSESGCKWCDVSKADCPDRLESAAETVDVLTSEW